MMRREKLAVLSCAHRKVHSSDYFEGIERGPSVTAHGMRAHGTRAQIGASRCVLGCRGLLLWVVPLAPAAILQNQCCKIARRAVSGESRNLKHDSPGESRNPSTNRRPYNSREGIRKWWRQRRKKARVHRRCWSKRRRRREMQTVEVRVFVKEGGCRCARGLKVSCAEYSPYLEQSVLSQDDCRT